MYYTRKDFNIFVLIFKFENPVAIKNKYYSRPVSFLYLTGSFKNLSTDSSVLLRLWMYRFFSVSSKLSATRLFSDWSALKALLKTMSA